MTVVPQPPRCEFCGREIKDLGEGYYDHLRQSKSCEAAWNSWLDRLVEDHPGGD